MLELQMIASQFREAIEKAKKNGEEDAFFKKFPVGQCGNTSHLVAQFLIDNGYDAIEYVNGTFYDERKNDSQSHAWLCIGENIIDITGDQFKTHKKPLQNDRSVYVGPIDDFYGVFECRIGNRHPHNGLETWWPDYYRWEKIYNIIKKYI